MALPLPNLDDRTFEDLVDEARNLIPRYCPEWTNQNPSDPGITLIELFAWLTESMLYRANHIPDEAYRTCLHLLMGKEAFTTEETAESLDSQFVRATRYITSVTRMVTHSDYDQLVLETMEKLGHPGRVICRINRDFSFKNEKELRKVKRSHVSVIVIPQGLDGSNNLYLKQGTPTHVYDTLLKDVAQQLDKVRLLTHRVRVVYPSFRKVKIEAEIVSIQGADETALIAKSVDRLRTFCDPVKGGLNGNGWEAGRPLYRSELYELLESIDSVDHIQKLYLDGKDEMLPLTVGINQFIEWSPEPVIRIVVE